MSLQISVPADSKRWSINIGPSSASQSEGAWKNLLFHFNPRSDKRKHKFQLLTNNMKNEQWGLIETTVIEEDLLFGRTFELIVQV